MTVQHFTGTLTVLNCARCGIAFGITTEFEDRRRKDHQGFMCPSGHSNVYNGESEEEKLRRENQRLVQNRAMLEDTIRDKDEKLDHARNQTRAFKGVVTRVKRRVGHGSCPCCKRTFKQLAAHMKNKHPEYHCEEVKAA